MSRADLAQLVRGVHCGRSIETDHQLLKSAGQNAEAWQQETGRAFATRLVIAALACLTVWHLQRDESAAAAELKTVLVRLSDWQMKSGVRDTAPSLLAGLEKLLALHNLLSTHDLDHIFTLAHRVLPNLLQLAPAKSWDNTYALRERGVRATVAAASATR